MSVFAVRYKINTFAREFNAENLLGLSHLGMKSSLSSAFSASSSSLSCLVVLCILSFLGAVKFGTRQFTFVEAFWDIYKSVNIGSDGIAIPCPFHWGRFDKPEKANDPRSNGGYIIDALLYLPAVDHKEQPRGGGCPALLGRSSLSPFLSTPSCWQCIELSTSSASTSLWTTFDREAPRELVHLVTFGYDDFIYFIQKEQQVVRTIILEETEHPSG
eukprot:PhM_4_TR18487/c0_g1_i1/m.65521